METVLRKQGNPGWGNRELESYTANSANIGVNEDLNNDSQNDGLLRITAKSEASEGYVYGTENSKNYTSARIRYNERHGSIIYHNIRIRGGKDSASGNQRSLAGILDAA